MLHTLAARLKEVGGIDWASVAQIMEVGEWVVGPGWSRGLGGKWLGLGGWESGQLGCWVVRA